MGRKETEMGLKDKQYNLLDLEELKKASGGSSQESWDVVDAIAANPNLSAMWNDALTEVCGWDIEDESDLCFCAAMEVLKKLGINSSFRDGMGAGSGNRYTSATNFLNMSQEQVLHIIRNYK